MAIRITNGNFSWKEGINYEELTDIITLRKTEYNTKEEGAFKLRNVNLEVKKGEFVAIIGE